MSYDLPDGSRTNDWEKANKAWRIFLKPLCKSLGATVESTNGDIVVFGSQMMRGNGKSALTATFDIPKRFVVGIACELIRLQEQVSELKSELKGIEWSEDDSEE